MPSCNTRDSYEGVDATSDGTQQKCATYVSYMLRSNKGERHVYHMRIMRDYSTHVKHELNTRLVKHLFVNACIHTYICNIRCFFHMLHICNTCIIHVFFIICITYVLNICNTCEKKKHDIVHICWLILYRSNEYMYK